MKIAFVHYGIGDKDGVNMVMRTNALSFLKRYKKSRIYFIGTVRAPLIKGYKSRVKHINIPDLDILGRKKKKYAKKKVFNYLSEGLDIYSKLRKVLKKMDYIIIENPNVGGHPAATYAYYRLVKKNHHDPNSKQKIVYRIHDFAEDRRGNFINLLKFRGTESSPYWHKVMFPKATKLGFVVINKSDLLRLHSHGIIHEGGANYIPNPLNSKLLYRDTDNSEKLRNLLIRKHKLDKDIRFLFYPVRISARKNVEEAIFLTQLLNKKFEEKYVLAVSLKTGGASNEEYYRKLNRFVRKHKLPVILGLNDEVALERKYTKSGRIKMYGVGDMYNICDKVISTSILEGFGMFFIESWFFKKAIIGRDLPQITDDFKASGINLEHLYDTLFIDGVDFKDYGTLLEKLKITLRLESDRFFKKFNEENEQALSGVYRMFDRMSEKELIKENRRAVLKEYSEGSITQEFMKAFRNAPLEIIYK